MYWCTRAAYCGEDDAQPLAFSMQCLPAREVVGPLQIPIVTYIQAQPVMDNTRLQVKSREGSHVLLHQCRLLWGRRCPTDRLLQSLLRPCLVARVGSENCAVKHPGQVVAVLGRELGHLVVHCTRIAAFSLCVCACACCAVRSLAS